MITDQAVVLIIMSFALILVWVVGHDDLPPGCGGVLDHDND